jgi:predicted MPP superfamily phosphohydrolase
MLHPMSRILTFGGFFAVMIALAAALHYYFWTRLVRDPAWGPPVSNVLSFTVIGLGVLVPAAMILHRALPRWAATPLAAVAFVWMGACLFLFLLLILGDIARAIAAAAGTDLERRRLLARGAAGAIGLATAGLTTASVRQGLDDVDVKEVEVPLERLPKQLSNLTIVQLSDVHVGPTIGRRFIDDLVEKSNAARPDIIVITGDLVDGGVAALREHTAPLGRLKARYGTFFVTGNHEYYSGVDEWLDELHRLGIRVLRNERVAIGDGAASIDLAGVDDTTAHRFGAGHGADVRRALAARDPEREVVLLAHQPKEIFAAAAGDVGLQLSGHTHGGQIWPFTEAVRLVQPYVAGLDRHEGSRTQIYVNRGAGYWGPPMRLAAPAEITKIVLVPA